MSKKISSELKKMGLGPLFQVRFKELVDTLGGATKAADRCEISRGSIYKWLDGKARPPLFTLAEMCDEANFSLDWIVGFDAPKQVVGYEFALIPRLNVSASAGDGALNSPERTVEMLAFRRDWLLKMGINARTAHVLTARGDSMDPTIRDGDILLVDTGIDQVMDEGIYVVVLFGQLFVKRLERQGSGALILRSDNPSIRDRIVPQDEMPELTVAGRVIWFGRSI